MLIVKSFCSTKSFWIFSEYSHSWYWIRIIRLCSGGSVDWFCYAFSFIRSFFRSFVRSFARSLVRSFLPSFLHSFIHSSFVRSFVHWIIRSFVRSFILSFIRSFFFYSFICFNSFRSFVFFSYIICIKCIVNIPPLIAWRRIHGCFHFAVPSVCDLTILHASNPNIGSSMKFVASYHALSTNANVITLFRTETFCPVCDITLRIKEVSFSAKQCTGL